MAKKAQTPLITTRLSGGDRQRFEETARRRGKTHTQLARESILFYLANEDKALLEKIESPLLAEIKKQSNRQCAMLAKVGIDLHTLVRYCFETLPEDHGELWTYCMDQAVHRMNRKSSPEETLVRDSLTAES